MAGLTTASLVGLEEPEVDQYYFNARSPSRFIRWLGLSDEVSPLNAVSLLLSALLSITWLVALNTLQPSVLGELHVDKPGGITGTLTLADELVALTTYFAWGLLADRKGVQWIAVAGHVICSAALLAYPRVRAVYPALLSTRMLFAVGASALVTSLSAALSGMSALPSSVALPSASSSSSGDGEEDDQLTAPPPSSRFAGLLGFATGLGALLAVTVFLPLPANLSAILSIDLNIALRWTFTLLAGLALFASLFLIVGLKQSAILAPVEAAPCSQGWGTRLKETARELPRGFWLATEDELGEVIIGFVGSFVSRASATIITGFLPLLVNRYFKENGLCVEAEKSSCREAYIFSSILTGTIQLVSLLLSAPLGYFASTISVPQPVLFGFTTFIGTLSFLGFALLPLGGPTRGIVWLWAVGAGLSQIGGIIFSLTLVANGRGRLMQRGRQEVAGVLSSAYSFCGGLGILVIAPLSGPLFDRWQGWPFALVATVQGLLTLLCLVTSFRNRRGRVHLE